MVTKAKPQSRAKQPQKREKIGKKTIKHGNKIVQSSPFEDSLNLKTIVRMNLNEKRIGAFYLERPDGSLRWVFGFDIKPIHCALEDEQIGPVFDQIEDGLKDLLPNESMTFHMGNFSSDYERQEELQELIDGTNTDEYKFFLMSEQATTKKITKKGYRKPVFWRVYVTYTIEPNTHGEDWIEKTLAKTEQAFLAIKGDLRAATEKRLHRLMVKAFKEGWERWQQTLSNKLGLEVRALDEKALWGNLWRRFNQSSPRDIPQLLIVDEDGLREEIYSPVHANTRLLESGAPEGHEKWVKLGESNFVGVLTLLDKPGGWKNKWSQLRYFWDVLSRMDVRESEIFCQVSRANEDLIKEVVQRVAKQSTTASDKSRTDVNARMKVKRADQAQEQLYDGALPIYEGIAILIHRPTQDELDNACRQMESFFLRPAWIKRETLYTWKVWLQTLPIVADPLLYKPYNRRLTFLSGEVPGLLPLIGVRSEDRHGLELISAEGGCPIHIDMFSKHEGVGLFGTTRSGKSVKLAYMMLHFLCRGYPVVAMDYPKVNGESTFGDFTRFVGGAYYDISKQSNNLMEEPDFGKSNLSDEDIEGRRREYRGFLESAIMTMVLGKSSDQLLISNCRAVITLVLNRFFEDEKIRRRYKEAHQGGVGSTAWKAIPTLKDYRRFIQAEEFELDAENEIRRSALNLIKVQLDFWLVSPVGKSISEPSSFSTDSQLLVFALTQLGNNIDAAVLALSIYGAAMRRALISPVSCFAIDESPVLFEYDEIANRVGRLFATGAGAGIRPILSAQDPDSIANSPAGSRIFQNMTTKLIGRIQAPAIASFEKILKIPKEIISKNSTDAFFPSQEELYSNWLLQQGSRYTYSRFYAPRCLLAAVANNRDELEARATIFGQETDKYAALARYAREL